MSNKTNALDANSNAKGNTLGFVLIAGGVFLLLLLLINSVVLLIYRRRRQRTFVYNVNSEGKRSTKTNSPPADLILISYKAFQ
ncbi:hypothetical protein niasHT_020760 [Heterodera trifolii]|uniref:Uncharacterized protein n=1 Tax=Heterodera trifolii TaxID=157864 RepID=A0ABD2KF05_9BILA